MTDKPPIPRFRVNGNNLSDAWEVDELDDDGNVRNHVCRAWTYTWALDIARALEMYNL